MPMNFEHCRVIPQHSRMCPHTHTVTCRLPCQPWTFPSWHPPDAPAGEEAPQGDTQSGGLCVLPAHHQPTCAACPIQPSPHITSYVQSVVMCRGCQGMEGTGARHKSLWHPGWGLHPLAPPATLQRWSSLPSVVTTAVLSSKTLKSAWYFFSAWSRWWPLDIIIRWSIPER